MLMHFFYYRELVILYFVVVKEGNFGHRHELKNGIQHKKKKRKEWTTERKGIKEKFQLLFMIVSVITINRVQTKGEQALKNIYWDKQRQATDWTNECVYLNVKRIKNVYRELKPILVSFFFCIASIQNFISSRAFLFFFWSDHLILYIFMLFFTLTSFIGDNQQDESRRMKMHKIF